MNEAEFRTEVVRTLRLLAAFPVENSVAWGVPDVCCTAGWIELKIADEPTTNGAALDATVRWTQRVWHRKWRRHGGKSWFLTLVGNQKWILHDGLWGSSNLGSASWELARQAAIGFWASAPDPMTLARALVPRR